MKRNDLKEIKTLDEKTLQERVKKAREEVSNMILDKNMNKLTDRKAITKKRDDLAKMLTILRQKQLLRELEQAVKEEE